MGCERLKGVPEYWCWEKVPANLKTKITWRREGCIVKPDAAPVGQKLIGKGAKSAWMLYSMEQTVPARDSSPWTAPKSIHLSSAVQVKAMDAEREKNMSKSVALDITPKPKSQPDTSRRIRDATNKRMQVISEPDAGKRAET